MALTDEQLERGIRYWRSTRWPQDFHHQFYRDMAGSNPHGRFDSEWWEQFYKVLRCWRANRPKGHAYLTTRASERFDRLADAWSQAIEPRHHLELADVTWAEISALPLVAAEIKDVASPVFTSKFCHFLAPRICPVIDNAAMHKPFGTYEAYFEAARHEWVTTSPASRDGLIERLEAEAGCILDEQYPVQTKLVELCFIGRASG